MAIGLLVLLYATGCSTKHHHQETRKFLVSGPLRVDTAITKEYVCQIRSRNHIEIRALETGYLENIFVDEGQNVKRGQRMFQIKPSIYQAEVDRAKAETDFAKIEYLNTKSLADRNVVSPNELAMAKAKYDKAKAELSLAQVHLGFTNITAPFSGIMDRFQVRLGSLVEEGELLTVLSDNSEMWVYFNVPEAEYLDYKTKIDKQHVLNVNLLLANNKIFEFGGKVETIEADFNNETGNIAFRATFPNPEGLLRHGETGNVVMRVPLENALLIPMKCTFEVLDKKYVYVVDKDNKLQSREIVIEAEMPHVFAVESGLNEGDKILLEGLRLVNENEQIEYDMVSPEEALYGLDLYAE